MIFFCKKNNYWCHHLAKKYLIQTQAGCSKIFDNFLIVKLSANTTDIKPLALACQDAGADCISAINTLRGLGVKLEYNGKEFTKTSVRGGLSGKCIKPVAMYSVNQINNVVDIPIIAIGGISTINDILEFLSVGAQAVQIGTANFINPAVCSDLAHDLENYIKDNGFKDFEDLKNKIRGKND